MSTEPRQLGRLSQIQVRYDPVEDRLLLRINTSTRSQLRCWLTRRIVQRLWPALENALGDRALAEQEAAPRPATATPEVKRAVVGMQREEALAKADFTAAFEEKDIATPLGEEPMLVSRVRLRGQGPGHLLRLEPADGSGFNLQLDNATLHSLCELVRRSAEAAGWALDLVPAGAPVEVTETSAPLH